MRSSNSLEPFIRDLPVLTQFFMVESALEPVSLLLKSELLLLIIMLFHVLWKGDIRARHFIWGGFGDTPRWACHSGPKAFSPNML